MGRSPRSGRQPDLSSGDRMGRGSSGDGWDDALPEMGWEALPEIGWDEPYIIDLTKIYTL